VEFQAHFFSDLFKREKQATGAIQLFTISTCLITIIFWSERNQF